MNITLSNADLLKLKTGCLVVPVGSQKKLSGLALSLDQASDSYLSDILKQGDLADKTGATLLLQKIPNVAARRILLISCGSATVIKANDFDKIAATQARSLSGTAIKDAASGLLETDVEHKDMCWNCLLYTSPSPRDRG